MTNLPSHPILRARHPTPSIIEQQAALAIRLLSRLDRVIITRSGSEMVRCAEQEQVKSNVRFDGRCATDKKHKSPAEAGI